MTERATAAPPLSTPRLAACHPDRPEKAGGLCQPCYRARLKAKSAAFALERSKATNDDRHETAIVRGLDKDPGAKDEFVNIMWVWLKAPQNVPECWKMEDGKRVRDWATEAKLMELAQRKAEKAATVLGKAYIVERREEVKPVPLPIGGEIDASGWGDEEDEIMKGEANDEQE